MMLVGWRAKQEASFILMKAKGCHRTNRWFHIAKKIPRCQKYEDTNYFVGELANTNIVGGSHTERKHLREPHELGFKKISQFTLHGLTQDLGQLLSTPRANTYEKTRTQTPMNREESIR